MGAKKAVDVEETNGRTPMSDEHKAALAAGREQGRAVRRYLEALEAHQPKRGRKRDLSNVQARVEAIDAKLKTADAFSRLHLTQERRDLETELAATEYDSGDILAEAEEGFIAAAQGYSQRKGISYQTWRECGVPPSVLQRAGISRSS